jgi:hypothetical protein
MTPASGYTVLSPLLRQALAHVPTQQRALAAKVAIMSEAGWGDMEIARHHGVSWRHLDDVRGYLRDGLVTALRVDYSDGEITRLLGVPTAVVAGVLATGVAA